MRTLRVESFYSAHNVASGLFQKRPSRFILDLKREEEDEGMKRRRERGRTLNLRFSFTPLDSSLSLIGFRGRGILGVFV